MLLNAKYISSEELNLILFKVMHHSDGLVVKKVKLSLEGAK